MRLRFIAKLSLLHLLRSWRTTVVLSFMVIFAVGALVFLAALAIGTNDAMIRNSIGLFSGHISGTNILPGSDTSLLQVEGVEHVLRRTEHRFLLWTDDIFETVLLMGVDPVQEKQSTVLWKKSVAGRYLLAGEEAIFINQETASRLQVEVGGQVKLGSRPGEVLKTFTVIGIYHTGISQLDQGLAFCPVEVFPKPDSPINVAVFLHYGTPTKTVVERYRELMPSATFKDWPEFMPDLKQLIDLNFVCMAIVMILVFVLVSVGISCAFLIFTLRNMREHGILKAMGILPVDTALLLVTQIAFLTIFAALIGEIAGIAAVALFSESGIDLTTLTSHNQYFSVSGVIYPRLTLASLLPSPLLAVFFGLAAAVWPAIYIIRKSPADILRSV
ncbi:ABC transporter permease [Desulforhopalus sp. IMCC35007]|uniref:ABC transporter permease n=1 Tax=Desulforhopalus sp. IMCC35007 TaxID=2569543 RepID=UPI0010AECF9C|nr:FtsX-like permease family protein [Desulforhopalus sp. IMCC35007]TKB07484.1 FtsX-like permease family protein [Desulforhopalus sp. IMCC35007]